MAAKYKAKYDEGKKLLEKRNITRIALIYAALDFKFGVKGRNWWDSTDIYTDYYFPYFPKHGSQVIIENVRKWSNRFSNVPNRPIIIFAYDPSVEFLARRE